MHFVLGFFYQYEQICLFNDLSSKYQNFFLIYFFYFNFWLSFFNKYFLILVYNIFVSFFTGQKWKNCWTTTCFFYILFSINLLILCDLLCLLILFSPVCEGASLEEAKIGVSFSTSKDFSWENVMGLCTGKIYVEVCEWTDWGTIYIYF